MKSKTNKRKTSKIGYKEYKPCRARIVKEAETPSKLDKTMVTCMSSYQSVSSV